MATLEPPALRPHVLVVDDDARLRELLRRFLSAQGLVVATAAGAVEARKLLESLSWDLLILDVMMPGESGLDLTRSLRRSALPALRQMPILLLTARGESGDRIEGFESGADDYLPKPFEPRELLLRLQAILRRAPKAPVAAPPALRFGLWSYAPERDELRSGDQTLRLTGMEAALMRALAAEPGVALSREALAERTRAADSSRNDKAQVNDRTVDVQVNRLRRRIGDDARNPRYLVTVRGEGYRLMPDTE